MATDISELARGIAEDAWFPLPFTVITTTGHDQGYDPTFIGFKWQDCCTVYGVVDTADTPSGKK